VVGLLGAASMFSLSRMPRMSTSLYFW